MPALSNARARVHAARRAGRFFRGLPSFFARPFDLAGDRQLLARRFEQREELFAGVVRRAIYGHTASPYRRLLKWAGIDLEDVVSSLASDGLDRTLQQLYDAGVYVSLDEFKGQSPIRRGALEFSVTAADFDNPLTGRRYEARTSGSAGGGRPVFIDLDLISHETSYHALFFTAARLMGRPLAAWHLAPPGAIGLKAALAHARLGNALARWFSPLGPRETAPEHVMFTRAMVIAAGLCGARVPVPEYTPPHETARVADWLGARVREGERPVLLATPSASVRTAASALERRVDISGSTFVTVGEPYSPGKAAVIRQAGCQGWSLYGMTEAGLLGLPCLAPAGLDDIHVLEDKVVMIQREKRVGSSSAQVPALMHTTLLPSSPKIMLNVESGDCGVLESRRCGCGVLDPVFTRHLHTIRSYEKLTCEGVHVLGGDLLGLVEQVLPAAAGGRSTDYQFLERELGSLSRVSLVISPEVGALDEERVIEIVLSYLRRRGPAQRLMADVWEKGRTLSVLRAAPYVTATGKIPPLRTIAG